MGLVLPYPNTPLNGQAGDATPINANFTAIAQSIQSFDGSQIAAGTIGASSFNSTVNPVTRDNLIIGDFVSSGCTWSTVSGLQGTMSGGILFINGIMITSSGVVSHNFTASQDTYIDIDYNGNVYYQGVSNNASSPSITANSIRIAIIITNGSAITSINQGSLAATAPVIASINLTVSDSLGNMIYPTNPSGGLLCYRQIISNVGSLTSTTGQQVAGLTAYIAAIPLRRMRIIAFCYDSTNTAAAVNQLQIWDGAVGSGTQLSASSAKNRNAGDNTGFLKTEAFISSASGFKTYNVGFLVSSGTAILDAATSAPAFISVEAI